MEESAQYQLDAKLFQEDSVRLIKDAFIVSSIITIASVCANIAVNNIFSDEKASAVTEKLSLGSAGLVTVLGGVGLVGAMGYQLRATIETRRGVKAAETEARLAELHRFTPTIEETQRPYYYPERYDFFNTLTR